jgi:hypothetical protein
MSYPVAASSSHAVRGVVLWCPSATIEDMIPKPRMAPNTADHREEAPANSGSLCYPLAVTGGSGNRGPIEAAAAGPLAAEIGGTDPARLT